jgi:hypothetical protein
MSDEQLREIERKVEEGDESARVKLLRERLRAGQLERDRLELAAYAGDRDARLVLGSSMQHLACACGGKDTTHGHPEIEWAPFADWAEGFGRWGREVAIRVGIAASMHVLPVWMAKHKPTVHCPDCTDGIHSCSHGRHCNTWPCGTCDGKVQVPAKPEQTFPALALAAAEEWLLYGVRDPDVRERDSYETDAMNASQKSSDIDDNHGTWEWAGITAMMCYRNMMEKAIGRALVIAADDTTEDGVRNAVRDAISAWALA